MKKEEKLLRTIKELERELAASKEGSDILSKELLKYTATLLKEREWVQKSMQTLSCIEPLCEAHMAGDEEAGTHWLATAAESLILLFDDIPLHLKEHLENLGNTIH